MNTFAILLLLSATSLTLVRGWAVPIEEQPEKNDFGEFEAELRMRQHLYMATLEINMKFNKLVGSIPGAADVQGIVLNTIDYTKKRINKLCAALPEEPILISGHNPHSEAGLTRTLVEEADKDFDILATRALNDVQTISDSIKARSEGSKVADADLSPIQDLIREFVKHVREAMKFEFEEFIR